MKRVPLVSVSAVAALAAGLSLLSVGRSSSTHPAPPTANAEGSKMLRRVPVAFVPNLGQWDHAARYVARVGAMTVFLEEKGWTFTLVERTAGKESRREKPATPETAPTRGVAVRMTFAGASKPVLAAEDRLPGRHHYFLGNDPAKWRSDVPLYASVRYREVQPGVDVRAREHGGHFEYDLLLQPDADLDPVEIAVEGIERMRVDGDALVLETRLGPVRMPAPLSWEESPAGEKIPIKCRYVLRGEGRFGFEALGRQPGWALTVDPGLLWSTFVGGGGWDTPRAIVVDAQGAATVVGVTSSTGFPTSPGAFDTTYNGGGDAFVTRLSPDGSSLVYSTFLDGSGASGAHAVALDSLGGVTVAGYTSSADFPVTPAAFDVSYNGGHLDAFVARLAPDGSRLVYSTFLGGSGGDTLEGVALDVQGAATVAGYTDSNDFPTTPGSFDTVHNGRNDALVARLSSDGSRLLFSTFLGGAEEDWASAVTVDSRNVTTIVGSTCSAGFPTSPGAFDTTFNGTFNGTEDAVVVRLSPTGSSLVYSTFLGGSDRDYGSALAVDGQGFATVGGSTSSTDFPTTPGAFDPTHNGGSDGFLARLSPTGAILDHATYLGGFFGADYIFALGLDSLGAATVVGQTSSFDFPTTPGAFGRGSLGEMNAFVARFSASGSRLVYSTFLRGMFSDAAYAVAIDARGAAIVAGDTGSFDFPTTPGAFDTSYNGGLNTNRDAFVTCLDMLPTGGTAFGRSSPGCTGPLAISVTSMPRIGNAGFALTCGNAPPNTSGLLALTGNRFASPVVLLGAEVWVDPTLMLVPLAANSSNIGASEVPLPIPSVPTLAGTRIFAQFFWAGPTSPPPCPPQGLSASNALEFVIQP